MPPLSEAETCRKFDVSKLQAAGRDDDPHSIAELDALLPAILDCAFKGDF
jgi:hypothetical protein